MRNVLQGCNVPFNYGQSPLTRRKSSGAKQQQEKWIAGCPLRFAPMPENGKGVVPA